MVHGLFVLYGGIGPQHRVTDTHPVLQASIRVAPDARSGISAPANGGPAAIASRARDARPSGPRTAADAAIDSPASVGTEKLAGEDIQRRAPRDDVRLAVASFDPAEYLPPSEVDQGATPVNEDLFDTLPLTGFQSGYWLVRLFIDQDGDVRELQFVESRGSERNTEELRFILAQSRFTPARRGEAQVRSQKMVEFSFEPGSPTLISATLPDPSATER